MTLCFLPGLFLHSTVPRQLSVPQSSLASHCCRDNYHSGYFPVRISRRGFSRAQRGRTDGLHGFPLCTALLFLCAFDVLVNATSGRSRSGIFRIPSQLFFLPLTPQEGKHEATWTSQRVFNFIEFFFLFNFLRASIITKRIFLHGPPLLSLALL